MNALPDNIRKLDSHIFNLFFEESGDLPDVTLRNGYSLQELYVLACKRCGLSFYPFSDTSKPLTLELMRYIHSAYLEYWCTYEKGIEHEWIRSKNRFDQSLAKMWLDDRFDTPEGKKFVHLFSETVYSLFGGTHFTEVSIDDDRVSLGNEVDLKTFRNLRTVGGYISNLSLKILAGTTIRSLDLESKAIQDSDLLMLAECRCLTYLNIQNTEITSLVAFENSQLEYLNCNNTKVVELCTLPKLKYLHMRYTRIEELEHLRWSPLLEELDIAHTGVRDIAPLNACLNLQKLDISETLEELRLEDIPTVSLEYLDVSSSFVKNLRIDCSNLRWLNISNTDIESIRSLYRSPICYINIFDTYLKSVKPLYSCTSLRSIRDNLEVKLWRFRRRVVRYDRSNSQQHIQWTSFYTLSKCTS